MASKASESASSFVGFDIDSVVSEFSSTGSTVSTLSSSELLSFIVSSSLTDVSVFDGSSRMSCKDVFPSNDDH